MKNKILKYMKYINSLTDTEVTTFISSLSNDEKVFFIETIDKVVELDDNCQIFILSNLVKKYKENGKLNYWEKTLYYNIKTFSEDDFMLIHSFIDEVKKPIEYKRVYGLAKDTSPELISTIKKFEGIGIINSYTGSFAAECVNLDLKTDYSIAFTLNEFVNELYIIINIFNDSNRN